MRNALLPLIASLASACTSRTPTPASRAHDAAPAALPRIDAGRPSVDAAVVVDLTPRELRVPSGDVTIFAELAGPDRAAVTMLVLPGGPGLTHEYLEPLLSLAGPARRVVLIDARGSGRSTAPHAPGDYGLDAYTRDVDAVIAALGVSQVELVGHSWGGLPALAYAIARPARVASLVLLGGGAPSPAVDALSTKRLLPKLAALQREGLVPRRLPAWTGVDCKHAFLALMPTIFADPRHPGTRAMAGEWRCAVIRSFLRAIGDYDLTPGLGRVTMPVLVMSGEADTSHPDDIAPALAPIQAKKIVLRGCGHFPWLECPDAFFREMDRFPDFL